MILATTTDTANSSSNMVPQLQIHPEGPTISRLVYGTWRILDSDDKTMCTPVAIAERIEACLQSGITTFDLV